MGSGRGSTTWAQERSPSDLLQHPHCIPEASLGPSIVGIETHYLTEFRDWRRRQQMMHWKSHKEIHHHKLLEAPREKLKRCKKT